MTLSTLTKRQKEDLTELLVNECEDARKVAINLLQAPESCYLMEVLAILSACCNKDTSLRTGAPNEKFAYLRRPDSFKASLYQSTTAIRGAFRQAHDSMHIITVNLRQVPTQMGDVLGCLEELDSEETKDIINGALSNLNTASIKCKNAATDAKGECNYALKVIEELHESALVAQKINEDRKEEAKQELADLERRKKQKEEDIKELKNLEKEHKKIVDEAVVDYQKRMSQTDNMGKIFGMMMLDCLTDLIQTTVKTVKEAVSIIDPGALLNLKNDTKMDLSKIFKPQNGMAPTPADALAVATERAFGMALLNVVGDDDLSEDKIHRGVMTLTGAIRTPASTPIAQTLLVKMTELLQVLKKAEKALTEKKDDKTWKAEYEPLAASIKVYVQACSVKETQPIPKQEMEKVPQKDRKTLQDIHEDNLKTSKSHLENQQKIAADIKKQKDEATDKLNDMISKIEKLNVEQTDLKQILQYLQEGIKQVALLETAWDKVIAFFSHIEISVNNQLIGFVNEVTEKAEKALEQQKIGNQARNILIRQATSACVIAAILMESAKLYEKISTEYIITIIDNTIKEQALSMDDALALKDQVMAQYKKMQGEIKSTIEIHNNMVQKNVYRQLEDQGFNFRASYAAYRAIYYLPKNPIVPALTF